ncbi:MAG: ABC transporter ATP-binding protein [Oligoflexales bacterium]|nr:ABC transporter ATP-binding protein [Oligoflexales bacterium]
MSKILDVKDLQTYFFTRAGVIKAVDGISFSIEKGETLAIVGESGSGKSVSMLSLLGLIPQPPGRIVGGSAHFKGDNLINLAPHLLRRIRGKHISMIFQDPMTSLNPYLKVSTQLMEVLTTHDPQMPTKKAKHLAIEALEQVGIAEADQRVDDYPHQFSGGMRQRVMIAMALIAKPELLIADEPTTALDVTVQAQILDIIKKLQHDIGVAVILITHDLGVVAGMADKVCVMYAGKMIETGSYKDIFYKPHHPYTTGLLKSTPRIDGSKESLFAIPGLPPDPAKLPPGCSFAPRCYKVKKACQEDLPLPIRQLSTEHRSHCYLEAQ